MPAIFEQVITLFMFGAAGFVLSKAGKCDTNHSKILSTLLVFVFSPCHVGSIPLYFRGWLMKVVRPEQAWHLCPTFLLVSQYR